MVLLCFLVVLHFFRGPNFFNCFKGVNKLWYFVLVCICCKIMKVVFDKNTECCYVVVLLCDCVALCCVEWGCVK